LGSKNNTPDETNGVNVASLKRHYSSVLSLLRHCWLFFDRSCGTALNFVFLLFK